MSHPLSRRTRMGLPSSEKHPVSRRRVAVSPSWDRVVSSLTEYSTTMTLVEEILFSRMRLPVVLQTTLPLPQERWSVADLDLCLNSKDRNRYWYWAIPQLRWSSIRVRELLHFELDHRKKVPLFQGQRLFLRSTLPFVSATEMPSHRWSTTWASSCELCNPGIHLSTL